MSDAVNTTDAPVIATFRFGPTHWGFVTLWFLMGPVSFTLFARGAIVSGDPLNLYIYLFLAAAPTLLWGLSLWRSRVVITEEHITVHRLRAPVRLIRRNTVIHIHGVKFPMARFSDGRASCNTTATTALRRNASKLRSLAAFAHVILHGASIEPALMPDQGQTPPVT